MKIFELIAELNGFDSNMNVYIEKNPSGAAEINGIQVRNLNKPVGKSGQGGFVGIQLAIINAKIENL